jgi:DnaJ-class molecular chaperone
MKKQPKIDETIYTLCKMCLGSGKYGVDFVTTCRFCNGTGKLRVR